MAFLLAGTSSKSDSMAAPTHPTIDLKRLANKAGTWLDDQNSGTFKIGTRNSREVTWPKRAREATFRPVAWKPEALIH